MKRRRLWAGLGAAAAVAAVAAGAAVWASLSQPDADSESASAPRTLSKAHVLVQTGILQGKYQDLHGAETSFKRALELDPGNKLAWYNLGVIAQQDGRPSDARDAYDKALKIDPKYTSALYNEAVLLKSSEPDRAIKLLRRAIAVNPKASTAHLQLGQALAKKGRDDEARDAFRRAVAVDPALHSHVPEPFKDSASPSPTKSQAGSTK
ncbi:tetratricopeptide repeat protein [Streptomyces sp. NPDC048258]|uniref:tetratricopeptide repeat protein n=1 Tax=Streptomyces sp. NPDC048258 TaxID=3365527 RepID=UPI003718C37C